jgi:phosphatidate cytidylyltransferase
MWDTLFEPKFIETAILIFATLVVINVTLTIINRRVPQFKKGAASTLSWLFTVPFIFLFAGMAWPYPLIILCLVSIYGAKNFFQMTGMYHRTNFVWATYFGIIFSTYCIYEYYIEIFNLMPMFMFFVICLLPLLRNTYKHMVQYMALTLMNFCFIWAFLHLGWIMEMPDGIYVFLYIVMLTEFFDTIYLAISRYSKRISN